MVCCHLIWYEPNHHHHHQIVLVARISLTLSRHSSLSFIALGRASGQHPVSSHCCWIYVRAGRPAFAWPCVGIHKSTSLMSSHAGHCWRSRDEPNTLSIGGRYLFTLGNLFVKTPGKIRSNMGWFAVTWSDMNLKQLLLEENIYLHEEIYYLRQLETYAATWDHLLSFDLIWTS